MSSPKTIELTDLEIPHLVDVKKQLEAVSSWNISRGDDKSRYEEIFIKIIRSWYNRYFVQNCIGIGTFIYIIWSTQTSPKSFPRLHRVCWRDSWQQIRERDSCSIDRIYILFYVYIYIISLQVIRCYLSLTYCST